MLSISYLWHTLSLAVFVANSEASLCFKGFLRECDADREEKWTYRGFTGPTFWGDKYRQCRGQNQSPIIIDTRSAQKDENLAQLKLENFDVPVAEAFMENNGHTIEVTPADGVSRTISVNGTTYSLRQFLFHWSCHHFLGSEHSLDGIYFAMEMHLVYMSENQEIAVVGVFLKEQEEPNEELQKIVDRLSEVRTKGTETELSDLNLNNLVPSNPVSYYRYQGSMTTPECNEGVTWSVVPEHINVGRNQMEEFRSLYSSPGDDNPACQLAGNCRPPQSLNSRTVYLSQ